MKKILVAAAMLAVMAGSASAQGGGGGRGPQTPEQMAARNAMMVDNMFKGITLTDAIKAKAVDIITKAGDANRAVPRDAADAMDQRAKITTQRNADLAALLSSDADKKTLADNIAAMPAGRGGRPPAGR
jgi:Spy/CpxP family protein refolding chaperone